MKQIIAILVIIISFIAIIFIANEFEIFGTRFWGVRKANAEREVFEQSQSYVQGKRQALIKYHHEWLTSDSSSRKAIEGTIRMEFASFDEDMYLKEDYKDLYTFLKSIKNK